MFGIRILLPVLGLMLLASALGASTEEEGISFPAPGKFCTGMTFDGQHLWVADYKEDALFKIDPATGDKIREIPSPGFWPKGLAWDEEHLWNVDSKQKRIFKVDPEDGTILKAIEAPSGNPEGLVWDGETLWVSDYKAKKIMKIDLSDGTAVQTIKAPAKSAEGLAFDGRYLWCADRLMDEIYMIDPDKGEVIIILDSPGPYPRGLTWDGKHLWNVDHQEDRLCRLAPITETYRLKDPRKARITLTHEVKVYGNDPKAGLKQLEVYFAAPDFSHPQQLLSWLYPENRSGEEDTILLGWRRSDEAESSDGIRIITARYAGLKGQDRWNQSIYFVDHDKVPNGTTVQTWMTVEAEISDIRYFIFPEKCGALDDIPQDIRELYTADGTKYDLTNPFIRDTARKVVGDETNPYWMARRIFDHVRHTLEYKLEGGWNTAPVVLKRGTGSCSEYTFCFIALCRAAGLPARYVGAIVVRGDDASLDDVFHRWPEVYLPNYGWIPMDPQGGDKPLPRDRAMNIGNLSNRFLITTQGGGDSEYLGWYYNYNEAYVADPQVEVNIETFAEWEPLNKD